MLHWGGFISLRRASGPWLWNIMFTYITILPTYTVVCIQRKFVQVPSPLIVPYIILIHGDAMNMSCNQDCVMVTSFLSGWKGLGELNIWETLLCMPTQWAWSGTYKLATLSLNSIWYLMTILRPCMQERVKNLQYGQNWSPFHPSIVHIIMSNMSLTLMIIGWINHLWNP